MQSSDSVASQALLRLLCWAPTKFFNPAMLEVAVLAWHWLMAATPSDVQVSYLLCGSETRGVASDQACS